MLHDFPIALEHFSGEFTTGTEYFFFLGYMINDYTCICSFLYLRYITFSCNLF